jgi:hypothetical protein
MEQQEIENHEQEMIQKAENHDLAVEESLKSDIEKAKEDVVEEVQSENDSDVQENTPSEEEQKPIENVPETQKEAEKIVEDAGLSFDDFYKEYLDNGSLSDETYETLESKGISKEVAENYIKGQEALKEQVISSLQQEVGGTDNYTKMIEWASENLSNEEQQAFNQTLENEISARFAIQGLYSRYQSANPRLIGGKSVGASTSNQGFANKTEMMQAMASQKYKQDADYRAEVQRKLASSNFM